MTTALSAENTLAQTVADLERDHLIQSYLRPPFVLERGKGCFVYDSAGKRYVDFISGIGVNAMGHGHPRIMKVMREQIAKLIHCSNLYYHPYQGPLAERLAKISGLQRAFFANSGAEAMEGALKIIKAWGRKIDPEKYEIVALNHSFSGRTTSAISITGTAKYRQPFEPLLPGVRFIDRENIDALREAVNDRTAGIVLEPILGEGGIHEVSREFAQEVMSLAKKHNALVLFDEIQCGLGRTGGYFAYQAWNRPTDGNSLPETIVPDIITVAKPLACGLPMGAIIANERAAGMITPGLHGSTFGGNALACRVAIEFLDLLEETMPAVRETGKYFARRLEELVLKYDFVTGVRGRGLMLGLILNVHGKSVVTQLTERGFLINCTADTVLRFLPPYIIENKHIDQLVAALDDIFRAGPPA